MPEPVPVSRGVLPVPVEPRFQAMADIAPVMVWVSGADRLRTFLNKLWLDFRGRTIEQEVGTGWTEGIHPDDRERTLQTYSSAFDAREDFRIEYRLRRHDGEYRWVLDSGTAHYDADGEFAGYIGSCIDIHDRKQYEEELEASEQRFRLAAEGARLGTWEWDLADTVTWSESLERLYGLAPGTFPGTFQAFVSRLHPDDRDRIGGLIGKALEERSDFDFEERIFRPDGEMRWLHSRGSAILDSQGVPERIVGICMDITDRKQFEEALAESRARAQAVLDTAVNGILTIDEAGIIEGVNPAALKMFGYSEDELIGQNVKILMPSPYREEHDGYLRNYHETGEARIIGIGREVEGLRKDGTRFPLELAVSELRLNGRRLYTGIVNDITARRRAEFAVDLLAKAGRVLQESLDIDATLRNIASVLVPDVADWVSVDLLEGGEIRGALVRHKDPAKVAFARELSSRYPPDPEQPFGVPAVLRSGKAELMGVIPEESLDTVARDDQHRELLRRLELHSYICAPIATRGSILGALTLVTAESHRTYDEQDLRLAEELGRRIGRALDNARLYRESELARAQLQRSIEAKDEFLGIVSHELRTPVTTIFGSSRLMSQRWDLLDEESRRELVQGVEQESQRMFQLVENLLLLARVEMGKQAELQTIDCGVTVRDVVDKARNERPEREFAIRLSDTGVALECVPTYVEQMLTNLLTNADKYTPIEEPIEIELGIEAEEVEFRVLDRGPGVEPEELPILFESFYRSPKVASQLPGKGLGLSVCRRLAEAQGGRVWARLRDGGGLEVGFALPRETKSEE